MRRPQERFGDEAFLTPESQRSVKKQLLAVPARDTIFLRRAGSPIRQPRKFFPAAPRRRIEERNENLTFGSLASIAVASVRNEN